MPTETLLLIIRDFYEERSHFVFAEYIQILNYLVRIERQSKTVNLKNPGHAPRSFIKHSHHLAQFRNICGL